MAITKNVIIRYTTDTKGVDKGTKKVTSDLDQVDKKAKSTGDTFNKLGGVLAGAFAVDQVIAFGKASVEVFAKYETALASLSSITGATGKDLEFLSDKASELSAASTRSSTEVLAAFELIGSAKPELLASGDALAAVTEEAIKLSEASGLDLEVAAGALTGTLNQFNLTADESSRVINALAAGSLAGASAIPETAQAIEKFGTVAAQSNVTVEESIALAETLADKNITGAEAGTQLRNIISILNKEQIGYVDGVFDLNTALTELEDANLSVAQRTKLFGLESATAASILVQNRDRFDELTLAVTGTNTAYEQAEINTNTYEAQQLRLKNAIESIQISLGGKLVPALVQASEFTVKLIDQSDPLVKTYNEFVGSIDRLYESLLTIARGFGLVREETDGVKETATALSYLIESLITGNLKLLFNAISNILDLVPKFVSGFNGIKASVIDVGKTISSVFSGIGDIVSGDFDEGIEKIKKSISEAGTGAADEFNKGFYDKLKEFRPQDFVGGPITDMIESIRSQVKETGGPVTDLVELLRAAGEQIVDDDTDTKEGLDNNNKKAKASTELLAGSIVFLKKEVSDLNKEIENNAIPTTERFAKLQLKLREATFQLSAALANIDPDSINRAIEGIDTIKPDSILPSDEEIAERGTRTGIVYAESIGEGTEAGLDEIKDRIKTELGRVSDILGQVDDILNKITEARLNNIEREREEAIKSTDQEIEAIKATVEANGEATEAEANQLQILSDKKANIEAGFDKKKEGIEKQAAARQKAFAIIGAIINTAVAVTEAYPNFLLAGLVAAAGAAEVALIASQGFKEGGYTGDGNPNDAAGHVHKGEYVFTSGTTKEFRPLFDAIHEGRFNMGDLMLNTVGFDDNRLIGSAKKNNQKLMDKLDRQYALLKNGRGMGAQYSNKRRLMHG